METKKCKSKIGGQAVIEGVMMRGESVMATAVRDPKGEVQLETSRFKPLKEKSVLFKVPIIRGAVSLFVNMGMGMKTLTRASEVYGEIEDKKSSNFIMVLGVILGIALALGLFIFLPDLATRGIDRLVGFSGISNNFVRALVDRLISGIIRIIFFVTYLVLISLIKDIKRLFRYHGAEHKTINCFEAGLPINIENVQKSSRIHPRCGTTFMFLVMVVAILFFAVVGAFTGELHWALTALIRIAGIPVVAGISYEILMFLAKFDNVFVKILQAPGLLLQKITTGEPDDKMVEVAIKAFNTVLEMQEDADIPEVKFHIISKAADSGQLTVDKDVRCKMEDGRCEDVDLDKREEIKDKRDGINLNNTNHLPSSIFHLPSNNPSYLPSSILHLPSKTPPQYVSGVTNFYGYDIKVNKNVLIPRFDTEHLAEQAILKAKTFNNPKILELCTGSGAVAVAIKKHVDNAFVTATDISNNALETARENAALNNAEIEFIKSDLFDSISEKFDIIVSNPPYIPTADIETLDPMVKDYEPHLALDGGVDGLDFYKKIANEYQKYLNTGGYLFLEVGINQADAVKEIFGKEAAIIKDYNNPPIERVLIFN